MITDLAPGSLINNQVKTDQRTIVTTTLLTTSVVCSGGSIPDGNGGCYYADTCDSLFGSCDCKGNTICCSVDLTICEQTTTPTEIIPQTESLPLLCGPGSRNRRCVGPPTDKTVSTTTFLSETTTPHNKCYRK